jgi:hypothetical protein
LLLEAAPLDYRSVTSVNNLAIKAASYGECNGSGDIVEMGY